MDGQQRRDSVSVTELPSGIDIVLRGYDRIQVHEALNRLSTELRNALADKDAATRRAEELAGQLSAVTAALEALRSQPKPADEPSFDSVGERISTILELAAEEANELRRGAEQELEQARVGSLTMAQESARIRAEAQVEADRMAERARHDATRSIALVSEAERRVAELAAERSAIQAQIAELRNILGDPSAEPAPMREPVRPGHDATADPGTTADHGTTADRAGGAAPDTHLVLESADVLAYRQQRRARRYSLRDAPTSPQDRNRS